LKIADTSGQDISLAPQSTIRKYWLPVTAVLILCLLIGLATPAVSRWSNTEVTISAERLRIGTVARGDFVRDLSIQGQVVAAVSPRL